MSNGYEDQVRHDHAEIRRARRQQTFARRRRTLLTFFLGCYLVFVVLLMITIPV